MDESEKTPRIGTGAGFAWSAVAIMAMLAATAAVWNEIPADARLPMHWNAQGEIDGYASKTTALFFAPAVAALIAVIFAVAPYLEPRKRNLAAGRALYHALWAGMMIVFAGVHVQIIASALGYVSSPSTFLITSLGLLFVVVGNLLAKTRSNFIMGVRTPWTLSSDYSWEKTHRWLGRLWVLLGLATFASAFFLDRQVQLYLFVGGAIASVVVAFVLSYVFWRNDPARQTGEL